MSFLDTIRRAKTYLQEQGRVSLSALKREFDLGDEVLDELIDELVDVQQGAAREGKVLSWTGAARAAARPRQPGARARRSQSSPSTASQSARSIRVSTAMPPSAPKISARRAGGTGEAAIQRR